MEGFMRSMGFRPLRESFEAEEGDDELITALAKGPEEVTKVLIKGVRIEAWDRCGYTALMEAARKGYIEVAKLLIQRGADLNGRFTKAITWCTALVKEGTKKL